MRPGLANQRLVDQERNEQHAAAEQQRDHRARSQPVQPIALIEAGINHRDGRAEQQHAAPVGIAQQLAIDRLPRRAEIDHQSHQRRDDHALPVQPLPSPMFDIEADQRRGGIQREPDTDGVDRDRRQPPSDRQVTKDDHQGSRHEGAEQQAVHDAEHDQRGVVVHERDHQRDQGVDQARNAKHAAQPEHRRKPCDRGRDENLRADAGSREPGALVKPQRERAAQIGQADARQPAVDVGQERAKEDSPDREQRLRCDPAARDRSAVGVVIFRHSPFPHRRSECW